MMRATNLFGPLVLTVVAAGWARPSVAALADEQMCKAEALTVKYTQLFAEGKFDDAIPLTTRACSIWEEKLGGESFEHAACLNNLALLYQARGAHERAEPLSKQALALHKKVLGPDYPHTATSLNNLAMLYQAQGAYARAKPLFEQALAITEKALGPDHPDTAMSLNNLALLYQAQGAYARAEPLFKQALAITEKALGRDHPDTAKSSSTADSRRARAAERRCRTPNWRCCVAETTVTHSTGRRS